MVKMQIAFILHRHSTLRVCLQKCRCYSVTYLELRLFGLVEVSACISSALGYQPTLAIDFGVLREHNSTIKKGSVRPSTSNLFYFIATSTPQGEDHYNTARGLCKLIQNYQNLHDTIVFP